MILLATFQRGFDLKGAGVGGGGGGREKFTVGRKYEAGIARRRPERKPWF